MCQWTTVLPLGILNKRLIDSTLARNASPKWFRLRLHVKVKRKGLGAKSKQFGQVLAAFALLVVKNSLQFLPCASERQKNTFVTQ